MSAALLEDLQRQGVRLWLEGEELRLRGSRTVLTPGVLDRVQARKPEIVALLRPEKLPTTGRCHHDVAGGCWLCKKYGRPEVPEPTVASVLEDPPYWLRSYLRGYRRGNVPLIVLSGAVAAAMGLSPHRAAEELLPAVKVCAPFLPQEPEKAVAA